MDENQVQWNTLGWTIVVLSILSVIAIKVFFPFTVPTKPDMKSALMGLKPIHTPAAFATIGFFLTMVIGSLVWTALDLIDRRGRALWMVPMMICFFLCLPSLPQSLYMFAGRKEN